MGVLERIKSKVRVSLETGCWIWQGAVTNAKAGNHTPCIKLSGKSTPVRRALYIEEIGGLDHEEVKMRVTNTCENVSCVCVDHLKAVWAGDLTRKSHKIRSKIARDRPSFSCGHPRTPENTRKRSDSLGRCKICEDSRVRARKVKAVQKAIATKEEIKTQRDANIARIKDLLKKRGF